MPRIQGLSEATILVGDSLLKTGQGYVFSITVTWKGRTAGDYITLRDGTTSAGNPIFMCVVPTAAGTFSREWSNGKAFNTGLYYKEDTAGFMVELTYK